MHTFLSFSFWSWHNLYLKIGFFFKLQKSISFRILHINYLILSRALKEKISNSRWRTEWSFRYIYSNYNNDYLIQLLVRNPLWVNPTHNWSFLNAHHTCIQIKKHEKYAQVGIVHERIDFVLYCWYYERRCQVGLEYKVCDSYACTCWLVS